MSAAQRAPGVRAPVAWAPPPGRPVLGACDIHCWRVSIAACAAALPSWRAHLPAAEERRRAAFRFERDRDRFVVTHALRRSVLARYAACAPSALDFTTGPHGKPALTAPVASGLHFNVTHSGDLVLMAVARDREVGIDAEQWAADLDAEALTELAATAFSATERAVLAAAPPADRPRTFFATWSRKEAYIKATGDGLSAGLDHFDVSATADDARLLEDRRARGATAAWDMAALDVGAGYAGALVWARTTTCAEPLVSTWQAGAAHLALGAA